MSIEGAPVQFSRIGTHPSAIYSLQADEVTVIWRTELGRPVQMIRRVHTLGAATTELDEYGAQAYRSGDRAWIRSAMLDAYVLERLGRSSVPIPDPRG
jgi:hypothetical protein